MSCFRERSGRTSLARVLIHSSIQAIRSLGPEDISLIGACTRFGSGPYVATRPRFDHPALPPLPIRRSRRHDRRPLARRRREGLEIGAHVGAVGRRPPIGAGTGEAVSAPAQVEGPPRPEGRRVEIIPWVPPDP